MSHLSATLAPRSAHVIESAPRRPLLVVERLTSSTDLPVIATFTWYGQASSTDAVGAPSAAPLGGEAEAATGTWI